MMRMLTLSGWSLFGLMIILAGFNVRKRLSMLPLGGATAWRRLHEAGGIVAVAIFWLHTGALWPQGRYEQMLAALFYLISLSGIIGAVLQRVYPRLLTDAGVEIIYERIPAELANLREQAESIVLACTNETGSDTLARHYLEALDWYFRRPRFFFHHALGGKTARAWQRLQCSTVQRYLNDQERNFLEKLTAVADYKTDVDLHYAAQTIMKGWLLFHVPLATAVMTLALWHVIVVYVYAL